VLGTVAASRQLVGWLAGIAVHLLEVHEVSEGRRNRAGDSVVGEDSTEAPGGERVLSIQKPRRPRVAAIAVAIALRDVQTRDGTIGTVDAMPEVDARIADEPVGMRGPGCAVAGVVEVLECRGC